MNLYAVGQVGFSSFFFFLSPVFVCCLITDKGTYVVENNYLRWQPFFFFFSHPISEIVKWKCVCVWGGI